MKSAFHTECAFFLYLKGGGYKMNIRKAVLEDAEGIAKVHVDSWRTTYKGIVPDSFLENMSYAEREELWKKVISESAVLVAENEEGHIIGFASGGKERSGDYPVFQGELSAIYLLEDAQGKGVGKKLLEEIMSVLKDQGLTSMLVFVLKENPATHFYQALGGEIVDEIEIEIGGKVLKELLIGWRSL